jgi:hypothetical protein
VPLEGGAPRNRSIADDTQQKAGAGRVGEIASVANLLLLPCGTRRGLGRNPIGAAMRGAASTPPDRRGVRFRLGRSSDSACLVRMILRWRVRGFPNGAS